MGTITLEQVTVDLPVYDAHHRSFRRAVVEAGVGGMVLRHRRGYPVVRALDGIDLELNPGDRLGVIGHNGAGKSTLLRVLGGLCEPTGGIARLGNSTCCLLNTATILDPEMTGHENIDHVATMLGISSRRQAGLRHEIERFTDLGTFLEMPVRTYSSGMSMRLSFALLTAQEPDLLLIDEALGAGDIHFVQHAAERLRHLRERASIIVMISHDPSHILDMCSRVIWLDHGRIHREGAVDEVVEAYLAR